MEDILQWAAVAAILAIAVVYIVRRVSGKKRNGCGHCELSDCCSSRRCDEAAGGNKKEKQQNE